MSEKTELITGAILAAVILAGIIALIIYIKPVLYFVLAILTGWLGQALKDGADID